MEETMSVKIIERGWPGHYILSDSCLFRRNTLLECGEERIVVSTVGNLRDSVNSVRELGLDRFYETMAFQAIRNGDYWEADVAKEIALESPWSISNFDFSSDNAANDMHEAVVQELAEKLRSGQVRLADTHIEERGSYIEEIPQ